MPASPAAAGRSLCRRGEGDADLPRIPLRGNWWIAVPVAALVAAFESRVFWLLNYVHVFTAILWTGTDIFMGFLPPES